MGQELNEHLFGIFERVNYSKLLRNRLLCNIVCNYFTFLQPNLNYVRLRLITSFQHWRTITVGVKYLQQRNKLRLWMHLVSYSNKFDVVHQQSGENIEIFRLARIWPNVQNSIRSLQF